MAAPSVSTSVTRGQQVSPTIPASRGAQGLTQEASQPPRSWGLRQLLNHSRALHPTMGCYPRLTLS